jgi:hypothetical protein
LNLCERTTTPGGRETFFLKNNKKALKKKKNCQKNSNPAKLSKTKNSWNLLPIPIKGSHIEKKRDE